MDTETKSVHKVATKIKQQARKPIKTDKKNSCKISKSNK